MELAGTGPGPTLESAILKILTRYVVNSFGVVLAMTLLVFTFVMSIGAIFAVVDLLAKGLSCRFLLDYVFCSIPEALTYSVPVSILTSALLTFGKLSADGEITAMKACGVSLWRVVLPVLAASLLASLWCVYVNQQLSPKAQYSRRLLRRRVSVADAIKLIDEGRPYRDAAGIVLYVGKKNGNAWENVRVCRAEPGGNVVTIRARRGALRPMPDGKSAKLTLYEVTYTQTRREPPQYYTAEYEYPSTIRLDEVGQGTAPPKKNRDLPWGELVGRIRGLKASALRGDPDAAGAVTALYVEANKRFALSLACVAFAFLGIPLGIKAHRKESSVGVAISIFLAFNFYVFLIVADSLAQRPAWQPEWIVWFPVVLSVVLGSCLVQRAN